jgi:predicted nuclease of predicted toxin-antitoxin system
VDRLSDLFPGSTHVSLAGLQQASDAEVWQFAKTQGLAIATADGDFYQMAVTLGSPPKVIWLRGCD